MTLPGRLRNKRSIWWTLGGIAITFISLYVIARLITNNLDALLAIRDNLRLWPILLTIPIFALGELVSSFVWSRIMNDLTKPLPSIQHQIIFVVTHATRRIPGTVWHVVGRVAWYERLGISKAVSLLANVLETVLIIWSGLIISVLLFPFLSPTQQFSLWWFIIGIALSGLVLHPRVLQFILARFGQEERVKDLHYRRVLGWLVYYLFLWLIGGVSLFLVINAVYLLPISYLPACIDAWAITGVAASVVLLLPSGLGLSEATLSLLLATQVPSSIAVTAALLMRVIFTLMEFLFAGVVFILRERIGLGSIEPPASPKQDV